MYDEAIKEEMLEEAMETNEPDFEPFTENTDLISFEQAESDLGAKQVKKKKRKKKYPDDEGITEFRCDQCAYVGKCRTYLNNHFAKHHGNQWFHCEYKDCEVKYRVRGQLKDHMLQKHQGRLFFCDKCSYTSKFSGLLKIHIMKHHEGVRFICDQCGHEAANPKSLGYHIKNIHEGKTYPCGQCEFVAKTYHIMKHHQNRKHPTQHYICDKCTYVGTDRGRFNIHVKDVHGQKIYKCEFCDFATKKAFSLKRHQLSKHKDELRTLSDS